MGHLKDTPAFWLSDARGLLVPGGQGEAREIAQSDLVAIEVASRLGAATRALGWDEIGRSIAAAFVTADRPWRALPLSDFLGIPRATLVRRMKDKERRGILMQQGEGWLLTEDGWEFALMAFQQGREIILGLRTGYSSDLIERSRRLGMKPLPGADTISFPKVMD